jgi:hypothetical protein
VYQSTVHLDLADRQYHFPSERPKVDDPIREELRELGAELVEAEGQEKDVGKTKSYHLKALAVVQSPWQEILYLVSNLSLSITSLTSHTNKPC